MSKNGIISYYYIDPSIWSCNFQDSWSCFLEVKKQMAQVDYVELTKNIIFIIPHVFKECNCYAYKMASFGL